jgi:signal transduction histidine kinase
MLQSPDGGVGLGLALVRQIARHHHGEARCLPREGGGTCFEVDLTAPA